MSWENTKSAFSQIQDDRRCPYWTYFSRNNSVADSSLVLRFGVWDCGGCGIVEFVDLYIMGLVIKAQNDWHDVE